MKRLLLLALLALSACKRPPSEPAAPIEPPAISAKLEYMANPWVIDPVESKITFEALEKGKPFSGRFERFNVAVDLDLSNPQTGRILAEIDLTSVDGGNADRNKVLIDSEMFYVRQFPTARFEADNITLLSDGDYEARGELSLKGISKNIVLPFSISQSGENAIVRAEYDMNRLDFNIGTGSFMSDKYVGYPVTIRIEIKARKANVEESLQ